MKLNRKGFLGALGAAGAVAADPAIALTTKLSPVKAPAHFMDTLSGKSYRVLREEVLYSDGVVGTSWSSWFERKVVHTSVQPEWVLIWTEDTALPQYSIYLPRVPNAPLTELPGWKSLSKFGWFAARVVVNATILPQTGRWLRMRLKFEKGHYDWSNQFQFSRTVR